MKSTHSQIDPLEETMENPDLPPLAAGRADLPLTRGATRRLRRIAALLGALALVAVLIGYQFAG